MSFSDELREVYCRILTDNPDFLVILHHNLSAMNRLPCMMCNSGKQLFSRVAGLLFILLIFHTAPLSAQEKVGLVLSGGGAKGISHIGVIQALEENNIPIDYITGTSMGAIVGALYAIGYSPSEMLELITSPDFMRWSKGDVEEDYGFFAYRQDARPSFLSVRFSADSAKLRPVLPNHLVSTYPMDMALIRIFATSTAYSGTNFDSLFVPFRCVASDINGGRAFVFRKGDLGTAVRASMSYPAYFKPLVADSMLLFDGGIYDNFPVGVMESDFSPHFIIGSNCSGKTPNAGEDDIFIALENMIMRETHYEVPAEKGILVTTSLEDVGIMDFSRAKEIYKRGYDVTMQMIDSIRSRVPSRRLLYNVNRRRILYRADLPPLIFRSVQVTEGNLLPKQSAFVEKTISDNERKNLTFNQLKEKYFKLIGTGNVSTCYPVAVFDSADHSFDVQIRANRGHVARLSLGGNISSSLANQGYLGAEFRGWGNAATRVNGDFFIGRIYNSIQFSVRQDYPFRHPIFYEAWGTFTRRDYYTSGNQSVFLDMGLHNRREDDGHIGLKVGFPFLRNGSFKLGSTIGQLSTRVESSLFADAVSGFEKYRFTFFTFSAGFEKNTLNFPHYATRGRHQIVEFYFLGGKERYEGGVQIPAPPSISLSRPVLKLKQELYAKMSNHFVLGTHFEGAWSVRSRFLSYYSALGVLPTFTPSAHSTLLLLEDYRSHSWLAAGVIPVWKFNDYLSFRVGAYYYQPVRSPHPGDGNLIEWSDRWPDPAVMGYSALSFLSPVGPITFSVNYYEKGPQRLVFLFNVGYTLYNRKGF